MFSTWGGVCSRPKRNVKHTETRTGLSLSVRQRRFEPLAQSFAIRPMQSQDGFRVNSPHESNRLGFLRSFSTATEIFAAKPRDSVQRAASNNRWEHEGVATLRNAAKTSAKTLS